MESIAQQLGISRVRAAQGIVRVANANMERAIRLVSVERGHDPRDFALVAFGGCGGLHACEIARELGIRTVLVPEYAGALSALGMLLASHVRDYAAGVLTRSDFEREFLRLERAARKDLPGAELIRSADIRYTGQSYELTVPWNAADPAAPFHRNTSASMAIRIPTARSRLSPFASAPAWIFQSLNYSRGTPVRERKGHPSSGAFTLPAPGAILPFTSAPASFQLPSKVRRLSWITVPRPSFHPDGPSLWTKWVA